ncbi:MAG: glutamate formimidoyltransferase [Ardenticatenaceae bacterium]|nr:glutamate formimidoyltransferase [Ardenticatenaceae bacterium]MCB8988404.1 glutamate formimidoyltransferase [Ardenticatenaceae bacterium]
MKQIVECVPNFSNGRNPEIYNGIAEAIRSVDGVHVLDVSADPDHNRTVITFVGAPASVEEAAFRSIAYAAQHINLDNHQGEHPRIGATDVCPFIPIKNISTDECVALANRLGQRVGEELGVAVYLYGDAATRPERKSLSAIRKGEYELWKEEVATNPARQPDYGPAEPQPWGATVIGVRPFLIAYNIYLNSDNVDLADQIARRVRFIGGGLRFVQAKGFLVEGQAQVSMNLTDFDKTAVHHVQEMVRREAAHYGLSITKAELIGLTPQKALLDAAKWYLQLHDLKDEQVLEHRLQDAAAEEAGDITPKAFLAATAEASPTPGGGSVAALAGALAAALTQMVAGLTLGRKKYADVQDKAEAVLAEADNLRQQLTAAISEDAAAYGRVMDAFRQKDQDADSRAAAIETATIGAGEVPLRVARLSRDVVFLAQQIVEVGNTNAVTDAAAGALLAQTAVRVAALNVKINAVNLQDQDLAAHWRRQVDDLEQEAVQLLDGILATTAARAGFAL